MKKKLCCILLFLAFFTGCGAQPPLGHSEGPELVAPVIGRAASAVVDRGAVVDVQMIPGLLRVESVPLFFAVSGLRFDTFYVYPGERVYEGQLLATLYTPHQREQVADQEARIARLHRAHALAAEGWEVDLDLMNLRYIEKLRLAAATFTTAAMEEAQGLYLEMDRARLMREQEAQWQQVEREDAYLRLEELREDLRGTDLRAPFDGVITYITPLPHGAFVESSMVIMFIAPSDATPFVEHTGDALPGRLRVRHISGDINGQIVDLAYRPTTHEEAAYNSLHNLPRRTRFTLPEGSDFPLGAAVRIFVYTTYIDDAVRIPSSAVFGTASNPYVYRRENGAWVPVIPTFGARTPAFAEILDGLVEGDELLVN
ncbi:MAG: efflux RND transporter periplasmic adaptor subunit [Defluviitaleaceae bacterium]|nr:efflux RND transporter periplasmic adaptor subunit [Defluviitaleaceae bacterium]MCL2239101.1 efflux RND transporter periplasmic adaptor subunit [Defluviitaleaceae bacterium]